jgi:hypothetical protein
VDSTARASNPDGARYSALVHTSHGVHLASCTLGTGSFPGVKRPERGVDHLPHLALGLKREQISSYTHTWPFIACYRVNLTVSLLWILEVLLLIFLEPVFGGNDRFSWVFTVMQVNPHITVSATRLLPCNLFPVSLVYGRTVLVLGLNGIWAFHSTDGGSFSADSTAHH